MPRSGLPARTLVTLSCGHHRKVLNPKEGVEYYCMTCDNHVPMVEITLPTPGNSKKYEVSTKPKLRLVD